MPGLNSRLNYSNEKDLLFLFHKQQSSEYSKLDVRLPFLLYFLIILQHISQWGLLDNSFSA